MIVNATRDDLRDESCMADEAFALSPISARAAQPSEEDYDAISQAFMETSRGRWFLGEYAKRNRNADTRMVLDAVARLEENIAAQRQPQPAPDNGLKLEEALAAIRSAVDEARVASLAALDGLALEDKLGPVRKGSRIIREIAWRWREIGADSRICDLLDSQVGAIEGACGQIASIDPLTAFSAAFDVIEKQLADLGGSSPASRQAAAEHVPSASAQPAPSDGMAPAVQSFETATASNDSEVTARTSSVPAEEAIATAETIDAMAETADVTAEPVGLTADAADDAHDEAILDMIALEMSAEDPADFDDVSDTEIAEIAVAAPAPADPVSVVPEPEPMAAAAEPPAVEPSLQPSLKASAETSAEASEEPSLGSSLIARGILSRPHAAGSDPLAPIRRMSQVEKIAFFS
jgi:hypothetical protein